MLQTCVSLLKNLLPRLFADAIQMTSARKEGRQAKMEWNKTTSPQTSTN